MSLCSNTLRANLRRSRLARPQTLLPFLYQTATIQQWQSTAQRSPRRCISSRPVREDDIPFEDADGNLPSSVDELPARKTTMTASERAAFEKLYKTFNTKGQGRSNAKSEHEELDQIADEYYEDDEDSSSNPLDKVFDTVLNRPQKPQQDASVSATSSAVTPDIVPEPETPQSKRRKEARAERDRLKKLKLEERERVRILLKDAQTDRDLWQVLERQVFDPLRKLDLDATSTPDKQPPRNLSNKSKQSPTPSNTTDRSILFANYPSLLVTALLILRHNFPTSPYPLMILPTIKSLGRSSYALGATTILYKHLLRTAWLQQSSYMLIDTLLTDMDANAIEFDAGIIDVLDAIIKEHDTVQSGALGKNMKLVYGLNQWKEDFQKVKTWRRDIAGRLGISTDVVQHRMPRGMRAGSGEYKDPVGRDDGGLRMRRVNVGE